MVMVFMDPKKRILVFISFYLPGFKAGGPIKTIQSMVSQLSGDLEFLIVTRDRDLGDSERYSSIKLSDWLELDSAKVMYLSPSQFSVNFFTKVINDAHFDALYLNSFFDVNFTVKPLLARRLGLIKLCPVVLAPRGEFSAGALALKPFKKKLYIKLSKWLGLYRNVTWQASSEYEKLDILNALNVDSSSVFIAKDLPEKKHDLLNVHKIQENATAKLVFLSRISPMKNLDFALRILSRSNSRLTFDIYGPIEDEAYWKDCLRLIAELPDHIHVRYRGAVTPDQVSDIFSQYDLFFFPTRGENYGHVIAESLSVGTPVLISDQTPWQGMSVDSLGWDLPLETESIFVEKIEQVGNMNAGERFGWRKKVMESASSRINSDADVADNKALFEFAIKRFNNKYED